MEMYPTTKAYGLLLLFSIFGGVINSQSVSGARWNRATPDPFDPTSYLGAGSRWDSATELVEGRRTPRLWEVLQDDGGCFNGGIPKGGGDSNCTCPKPDDFSGFKCFQCRNNQACSSRTGDPSVCDTNVTIRSTNKQFSCDFNVPLFIKLMSGGRKIKALVTFNFSSGNSSAFFKSDNSTCKMELFRVEPDNSYVDSFFGCTLSSCSMQLKEEPKKDNSTGNKAKSAFRVELVIGQTTIVTLCFLLALVCLILPKGSRRQTKVVKALLYVLVACIALFIGMVIFNMQKGERDIKVIYECRRTACACSRNPPAEYQPFCSRTALEKFILPKIKGAVRIKCGLRDNSCEVTLSDLALVFPLNCTASECVNTKEFPDVPSLPESGITGTQRTLLLFIALGSAIFLQFLVSHMTIVRIRTQRRIAEFIDIFGMSNASSGVMGVDFEASGDFYQTSDDFTEKGAQTDKAGTYDGRAFSSGIAVDAVGHSSGNVPSLVESNHRFGGLRGRSEHGHIREVTRSPFQLVLTDLEYSLPTSCFASERNAPQPAILQQINFSVRSGEVLAILGPSGAGKTSLLDLLSARGKQGKVIGSMTFNGTPLVDASKEVIRRYRNIIGYVSQEDTLIPALTVQQTIEYAARLKLPQAFSEKSIQNVVSNMIKVLRLERCKDTIIGDGTNIRGVSGGERRRVSIAVELLANPRILFLDEPTSGLDAVSAKHVVEAVVQLAKQSPMQEYAPHYFAFRPIVIFSIHQPSQEIYELFDKILLLSCGVSIYCGPAATAAETLEARVRKAVGNVRTVPRLADHTNHAEHLMKLEEIIDHSARMELQREDVMRMVEESKMSSCAKTPYYVPDGEEHPYGMVSGDVILKTTFGFRKYYADVYKQLSLLTSRAIRCLLSSSHLILCHALVTASVSTLMMFLYREEGLDLPGALNRAGSVTFLLLVISFASLSCLEHLVMERKLFVVERENGYYTTLPYLLSKILVDVVLLRILPALVISLLIYVPMGLRLDSGVHFFWFIFIVVLFSICITLVVMCVGIVTGSFGPAALLSSVVILWNFVFGGLLVQSTTVPAGLRPFQLASPLYLSFESLLVNELDGQHCTFTPTDATGKPSSTPIPIMCVQYLTNMGLVPQRFGYDVAQLGFTVLVLFCVAWLLLCFNTVVR